MKFLKTLHHSHHSFPGTGCGERESHVPATDPFAARGWEAEPKPTKPEAEAELRGSRDCRDVENRPERSRPCWHFGILGWERGADVCPQDGSGC